MTTNLINHYTYDTPKSLRATKAFFYTFVIFSPNTRMNDFIRYLKNAYAELHKVSFPTRRQAIHSAIVVLIFTGLLSLAIAIVDAVFDFGVLSVGNIIDDGSITPTDLPEVNTGNTMNQTGAVQDLQNQIDMENIDIQTTPANENQGQ